MEKVSRNSNFELMRICSMFLIVFSHTLSWGGITDHADSNTQFIIYLLYGFFVVHVNSFILLTGYFQSTGKFKGKKVFNLVCLMLFYRFILYFLSVIMGWQPFYNMPNFIYNLLPIENLNYWFLNVYIVLYILSPYLNKLINSMDKKSYINLLLILFVTCTILPRITLNEFLNNNSGYSIIQFIFMYLIGAFIYKYKDEIKIKILKTKFSFNDKAFTYFVLYFLFVIIKFLINYYGYGLLNNDGLIKTIGNNLSYSYIRSVYDDPLVVLASISYFLMFKNIKLKSKIINFLAKSTNETYLIHMNKSIRPTLYTFLGLNLASYDITSIPLAIKISIIIMLFSCLVYYLRQYLIKIFKIIYDKILCGGYNEAKKCKGS